MTKTYEFQADIARLMNMIINSFYSNKDVFLRELISNSSDAIDKIRMEHLTNSTTGIEYFIKISADKENKTLLIEDNGIGMDEDDLIKNLSTIAHSGTRDFVEKLGTKNISDFIGQFGVGFYASYLVANKVEVFTRKENGTMYHWESDASSSFSIEEIKPKLDRGTIILLHLKDAETHFLDENELKQIIKQHSQFISYPIQLLVEKEEKVTKNEVEEVEEDDDNDNDQPKVEEAKPEETKTEETIKVPTWETVNGDKPIWYNKPDELTLDDYNKFYKTISNDYQEPLYHKHFEAEGSLEFRGILYIPNHVPFDMFEQSKKKRNIKLYVKKVFIMDDCKELVPEWMSFVTGVIDSCDLPLNVSREMLQQNKVVQSIKKHVTKQVLKMIDELDEEKFNKFYENFSKNIKLAIYEGENKLAKYLRFKNNNNEESISLDQYIDSFKDEQKSIYYISGDSLATIKNSVYLSKFNKLGYTVLYLTEPIDEFMVQKLNKYEEYDLVNITKDDVKLPEDTTSVDEKDYEKLCKFIKDTLDSKIESVKLSTRLVDEPTCVVTSKFGWTANMERIMKAQALGDNKNMMFMQGRKIFEINPEHKLIIKLKNNVDKFVEVEQEKTEEKTDETKPPVEPKITYVETENTKETTDLIHLLYDVALLHAGFNIENMNTFSNKLYNLIN